MICKDYKIELWTFVILLWKWKQFDKDTLDRGGSAGLCYLSAQNTERSLIDPGQI